MDKFAIALVVAAAMLSSGAGFAYAKDPPKGKSVVKCETTKVCIDDWLKAILDGKGASESGGLCINIVTCKIEVTR